MRRCLSNLTLSAATIGAGKISESDQLRTAGFA